MQCVHILLQEMCIRDSRTPLPITTRESTPPTKPNLSMPSSVIFLTITPTSSMCAHTATGRLSAFFPLRKTITLPMASVRISSARGLAFLSTNSRTCLLYTSITCRKLCQVVDCTCRRINLTQYGTSNSSIALHPTAQATLMPRMPHRGANKAVQITRSAV